VVCADPKELRRQRERERYALNSEEILKRRLQARDQKKAATAATEKPEATPSHQPSLLSQGDHNYQSLHTSYRFILIFIIIIQYNRFLHV
jgi:hypothetical protein